MIQQRTLPPEPASASAARRFAQDVLRQWDEGDLAEVVALLVSELVTNAVLHAGSPVQIAVRRRGPTVRIEVTDESPVLPTARDYTDDATTGRGLSLLEALATKWGIDPAPQRGKVVWFEVPATQIVLDDPEPEVQTPPVVMPDDEVVIRLLGAPVQLFPAAQQHTDAMLREYALLALQLNPSGPAVPHLLVDTRAVAAQLRAAVEVGSPTVDLIVSAPAPVRDSIIEARDALQVADRLAADDKLLNPPALAEVRACREWFLSEVLAQLDGRDPTPWSEANVDTGRREPIEVDHHLVVEHLGLAVVVADDENHIAYVNQAAEQLLGWDSGELAGQRLTELIPARLREAHVAGYTRFLVTREPRLIGNPVRVPALRRDGSEVDVELTLQTITPRGARQMFVAVLREIDHDHSLEKAADAEEWLRVVPQLVAAESLTQIDVLNALATNLDWDFAAWWEPAGERLGCVASWSVDAERYASFDDATQRRRFRTGEGLPGRVWERGEPEWIADVVRDANFPRVSLALEHGLRTACAFPLVRDGHPVGVIELFTPELRPGHERILAALQTLGRVTALVVPPAS